MLVTILFSPPALSAVFVLFVCKDCNTVQAVEKSLKAQSYPVRGPFMLKYSPILCKNDITTL